MFFGITAGRIDLTGCRTVRVVVSGIGRVVPNMLRQVLDDIRDADFENARAGEVQGVVGPEPVDVVGVRDVRSRSGISCAVDVSRIARPENPWAVVLDGFGYRLTRGRYDRGF